LDHLGRRALFLIHEKSSASKIHLPEMAGLIVEKRERPGEGKHLVSVILENEENADIFSRLCEDIVEVVSETTDENAAVSAFLERTWKWHELLKGKWKPTLSRDAQMGLMGELWTLLHILTPNMGIETAVKGWKGAEGAPKDFELSDVCIECKSRGAAGRSRVRITSEHQLEDVPGHKLILLVLTFAACREDDPQAMSLHGIASDIRSELTNHAPQSMSLLEQGLNDAGYDESHEYDLVIRHRSTAPYAVRKSFPRIVPGSVPVGPVEIGYDLPLENLEEYLMDQRALKKILRHGREDDARN